MGRNRLAGVRVVAATVKANDGDYWIYDDIAQCKVKRGYFPGTTTTSLKVSVGDAVALR
ncbi:hypothetical protein ACH3Y9_38480 [Streptomyces sp. WSLK1-5]|uniref:hypothetical protein n=1 Tax=unclassified Streptomyces TaxID=2593676 RepID=UPI00163976E5|nr:hypothetical protein [Streptomyces sp. RP5T]